VSKVSVIIPTFNCKPYIEQTIASVACQTESDLQIIAVDDGSTDGTWDALNRLACKDRRLSIYSISRSGFPGAVRNRGLTHAQGEYICFLDGDDLYHPEKIRKSLAVFDSLPDADCVFHDFVPFEITPDGQSSFMERRKFHSLAAAHLKPVGTGTYICLKSFYVFMSLQFVPFHISSVMLRRSLLDCGAVWFREDISPGEDGDLWLRLARDYRMAFLDQPLSYYRQRPGSVTADPIRCLRASIRIHIDNLKRGAGTFGKEDVIQYRSKIAQELFDLGYQYFQQMDVRDSRIAYGRSMRMKFSSRAALAYLKTFAPESLVKRHRHRSSAAA
jgi:glycosyltransferase involved in cell wall biosynthesis